MNVRNRLIAVARASLRNGSGCRSPLHHFLAGVRSTLRTGRSTRKSPRAPLGRYAKLSIATLSCRWVSRGQGEQCGSGHSRLHPELTVLAIFRTLLGQRAREADGWSQSAADIARRRRAARGGRRREGCAAGRHGRSTHRSPPNFGSDESLETTPVANAEPDTRPLTGTMFRRRRSYCVMRGAIPARHHGPRAMNAGSRSSASITRPTVSRMAGSKAQRTAGPRIAQRPVSATTVIEPLDLSGST